MKYLIPENTVVVGAETALVVDYEEDLVVVPCTNLALVAGVWHEGAVVVLDIAGKNQSDTS